MIHPPSEVHLLSSGTPSRGLQPDQRGLVVDPFSRSPWVHYPRAQVSDPVVQSHVHKEGSAYARSRSRRASCPGAGLSYLRRLEVPVFLSARSDYPAVWGRTLRPKAAPASCSVFTSR